MFLSEFLPKYGRERREILVHGGVRTGRKAVAHETGDGDYHTVRQQLEGRKDMLETLLPDSMCAFGSLPFPNICQTLE